SRTCTGLVLYLSEKSVNQELGSIADARLEKIQPRAQDRSQQLSFLERPLRDIGLAFRRHCGQVVSPEKLVVNEGLVSIEFFELRALRLHRRCDIAEKIPRIQRLHAFDFSTVCDSPPCNPVEIVNHGGGTFELDTILLRERFKRPEI